MSLARYIGLGRFLRAMDRMEDEDRWLRRVIERKRQQGIAQARTLGFSENVIADLFAPEKWGLT